MDYLTVADVAELKGCTVRYVQDMCKVGKIKAITRTSAQNNRAQYLIPISALPDELQRKYYLHLKSDIGFPPSDSSQIKGEAGKERCIEDLSAAERAEAIRWKAILEEWQELRVRHKRKTDADRLFVTKHNLENPDEQISTGILYRKYAALKQGNIDGLIDHRGGWNRRCSSIPQPVWEEFLYLWLDDRKPPVTVCYRDAVQWAEEFHPELAGQIPTERSFRRRIKTDLSMALLALRDGDKATADRCLPYVNRLYDDLHANDVWIADNHTLDIVSVDSEERAHRLYLTAFIDAKSGVMVGWNLCDNPCSESTLLALRHGIGRFGIPRMVYFDNGREFLTHDIGGRGHRRRKDEQPDPPTILARLGIEMRNAMVRNAKAKPIERTFGTVKNLFSRAFEGFCGGTILERPESLKRRIKSGKLPIDTEVRAYLSDWVDGEYNMQLYGGSENRYKGASRIDVWNADIQNVGMRMAGEAELNLMMYRTTRYQKVKRNGVYIDICGEKLWYYNEESTYKMLGRQVYVRYDPADLSSARIYDSDDRYLETWGLFDIMLLDFIEESKEAVANAQALRHRVARRVKEDREGLISSLSAEERLSALDIHIRRAHEGKQKFRIELPRKIIPVMADEPTAAPKAVGECVAVTVDLKRIKESAERRKAKEE